MYTANVRKSMMFVILLDVIGDFWERAMEREKIPRNCLRDVWYMTFTMDISTIRKYRILPRVATEERNVDCDKRASNRATERASKQASKQASE